MLSQMNVSTFPQAKIISVHIKSRRGLCPSWRDHAHTPMSVPMPVCACLLAEMPFIILFLERPRLPVYLHCPLCVESPLCRGEALVIEPCQSENREFHFCLCVCHQQNRGWANGSSGTIRRFLCNRRKAPFPVPKGRAGISKPRPSSS